MVTIFAVGFARRSWVLVALLAGAIAGLAGLVACGLTADFSGLQGGGGDSGGSSPVNDAGAGVDAVAPDGGFCASLKAPVQLCADFDEDASVSAGWTSTDVYTGNSIGIDNVYFSPPGSFLSSINASSAPSSARLQEDMPVATTSVHMEFEMLLPPLGGDFEICTLHEQTMDGTTYGIFYKYSGGNLLVYLHTLEDDGGEINQVSTIGAPPAGWLHVEIDVTVGSVGSIVVKHEGTIVLNETNLDTSTDSRTQMFVELGYYSNDPVTAVAHFDNVIIDWP